MQSDVLKKIEQLLAEDGVIGVLGLREEDGGIVPHVFTDVAQAEQCVTEIKWPLAKTAWRIAGALPEGAALGLVCRGCDARALRELLKAGQLRPGAVRVIGLSCSAELAASCRCETPFPPGESPPAGADAAVSEFRPEPGEAVEWREHFARCIKCYGCRNSCPICVCPTCKLEDDGYVTLGSVPPDPLAFHLIRAMHLADRCVGCGACEESCPAGLPLLSLHLAMRKTLRESTGYVSGTPDLSPLLTAGREEGALGAPAPHWEDTLQGCSTGGNHAG